MGARTVNAELESNVLPEADVKIDRDRAPVADEVAEYVGLRGTDVARVARRLLG